MPLRYRINLIKDMTISAKVDYETCRRFTEYANSLGVTPSCCIRDYVMRCVQMQGSRPGRLDGLNFEMADLYESIRCTLAKGPITVTEWQAMAIRAFNTLAKIKELRIA